MNSEKARRDDFKKRFATFAKCGFTIPDKEEFDTMSIIELEKKYHSMLEKIKLDRIKFRILSEDQNSVGINHLDISLNP